MSSISAGTTTTTALVSTADTTGALELKTGASNITGLSISSAQVVTIPGDLTVSGTFSAPGVGGNYALQSYVAPATWTKPADLKAVKVTVVGAGGNGGASTPSPGSAGGGGGGGGAAIEFIPAPSIPGPVAVTAGPGTNSFGPFCSATAGSTGGSSASGAVGGGGGAGSGGTFNVTGGAGGPNDISAVTGGQGGPSVLGGGGAGANPGSNGAAGGNYGGGGGGGARGPAVNTGGTGAPGIVVVEEFY